MRYISRTIRVVQAAGGIAFVLLALPSVSDAATPWGLVARRAIGRIEQLSQPPQGEQPGFDVATVVLNADVQKVYATTIAFLRRSQEVHIVAEDAANRTVQFSNGKRSAGITVSDLGTQLSQIVVGSAILPGQDSATLRITDGILRVCAAMKVVCSTR